jgi:hypothetical protein
MTSLRLPGQHGLTATARRRCAQMMICVLKLRRQFLLIVHLDIDGGLIRGV